MTGYGEARYQSDTLTLAIELRAVNNRYLKVSVRASDPYHLLEPEFEKVIRRTIRRGTLQVHLRCEKQSAAQDFRLNTVALRSYLGQLRGVAGELGLTAEGSSALLAGVLALPRVGVEPGSLAFQLHEDWPIIEGVLEKALASLQAMRQEEGRAMAQELLAHRDTIARHLERIRQRIPIVTTTFRDRLHEPVRALLAELDVDMDGSDLIKVVLYFSRRRVIP